uniref:Uncharacterized protein n=1 Tax=Anguilla anguilla TaxID=7936 RepID=A0A0E9STQ6_ANGAN
MARICVWGEKADPLVTLILCNIEAIFACFIPIDSHVDTLDLAYCCNGSINLSEWRLKKTFKVLEHG